MDIEELFTVALSAVISFFFIIGIAYLIG